MTTIYNAERRREYKRTQEQHQKPRPAPHSRTRRGDQPPPTERSRAPDSRPPQARAITERRPHEDDEPTRSGRAAPAEHPPRTHERKVKSMDKRQVLIEDTQARIDNALKALNEDKTIFDTVMKETTTAAEMLHIYTPTEHRARGKWYTFDTALKAVDESAAELAKLYAELEQIKYCADSEIDKLYRQRDALTRGDIIAYFEEITREA